MILSDQEETAHNHLSYNVNTFPTQILAGEKVGSREKVHRPNLPVACLPSRPPKKYETRPTGSAS
jgi:hypothetical protein